MRSFDFSLCVSVFFYVYRPFSMYAGLFACVWVFFVGVVAWIKSVM